MQSTGIGVLGGGGKGVVLLRAGNGWTDASLQDARQSIGAFVETIDNRGLLHSPLGDKPPVEFEDELRKLEAV